MGVPGVAQGQRVCTLLAQVSSTGEGGRMASYHLSLYTIKRSAGCSAMAAAAYRVGERIECQREGRIHDCTRKQGIEETFILTSKDAPDWATDRSKLWNEVEASETRRNDGRNSLAARCAKEARKACQPSDIRGLRPVRLSSPQRSCGTFLLCGNRDTSTWLQRQDSPETLTKHVFGRNG